MKSRIALAVGAGLVAASLSSVPLGSAQAAPATTTDGCVTSVPEPGSTEKVKICYTIFRPAGASSTPQVPFIMHSHGWGGLGRAEGDGGQAGRHETGAYGESDA